MKYFTYAYLREDGTPFYIGKGTKSRAGKRNKNDIKPGKNKILILKTFDSEFDAYKHEMYMISVFGRKDLGTGILHNRTDGGDGASNRVVTDYQRTRMREVGLMCVENKIGFHSFDKETQTINRMKGSLASQKSCSREFRVIYKDGTIFEGNNVTEFCRQRGIAQSNFTSMLKGRQKSAYGYRLI